MVNPPGIVTLVDGTQVLATSEEWRHQCEAASIAARPTLAERRMCLDAVQAARGKAEADRLRATMSLLWAKRQEAKA